MNTRLDSTMNHINFISANIVFILLAGTIIGGVFNPQITNAQTQEDSNLNKFLIDGQQEVISADPLSYNEVNDLIDENDRVKNTVETFGIENTEWYEVTAIDGNGDEVITTQSWSDALAGTTKMNDYRSELPTNPTHGNQWLCSGPCGGGL